MLIFYAKYIQKFKVRFGSELVKVYFWKKDINLFKMKAINSCLKLMNRKGNKDIIDQEREKFD
jgi:hypothetical protein